MIPTPPRAARARSRRPVRPLEQLAFELGPERPRWTFSRPAAASPHLDRIRERIEFVRYFFPELDGVTVRVGMCRKPGVLGWGSLDPERPGIWVRPRRLEFFTIAHELTHLLQARGLVPRGERACDLWAAARTPLVLDVAPGYLRLPHGVRGRKVSPEVAARICEGARRAIEARAGGDRRYLQRFEVEMAESLAPGWLAGIRRAARRAHPAKAAPGRRRATRKRRRAAEAPPPVGFFERVRRLLVGRA